MNKHLFRAAGLVGLLAIGWVAAGYLRGSPVALAMTLLIGAFYVMGVLELHRYQQTTEGLNQALLQLANAPADVGARGDWLGSWLATVPAPLRHAVRLRVDGERAGLPGPALAPALAGLLVLLGMLGTFVGMVVTLQGTGMALESAVDVQTLRDSLAAPVRGLGLAFGTSVAGVAGSAMLGLMAALCRRSRQQAGQLLDTHTATTLRPFSRAQLQHQQLKAEREATVQLRHTQRDKSLKLQQLQHEAALQQQLRQHQESLQAQLQRHKETLQAQQQLEAAFREAEQHRVASGQLQQQHHEAALKQQLQQLLQQHHDALDAQQQRHDESLKLQQQQAQQLPLVVERVQGLMTQLDQQSRLSAEQLLASQQHFLGQAQQDYGALAASVHQTLQRSLSDSARVAATTIQGAVQDTMAGITRETAALHGQVAATVQQQLHGFAQRFQAQSTAWVDTVGAQVQDQSATLLRALDQAHAGQQAQHTARDEQRLAAWGAALAAMALKLEHTTQKVTTQAEAQARSTIAEVARLVQTANEAPREAALVMTDVVTQLRDRLSESLVRDNATLEERGRIMATLNTLLGAVQHTSTEQKAAIDQMVASTSSWLQQAGARFTEQVDAESARLETVSAQLTSSAVEVASLGEAFATAVDLFSQSNGQLVAHLQRLEEALARSSTRSDEQLAYYVAQAREVIDLSLLSQKQIVDDLQRLASRQAAVAGAA